MLRGNSPFQHRIKNTLFSCECFLRYYGGQLKTAVKTETTEKIDDKR